MLVNSAGISHPGEFDTLTVDQFRVSVVYGFCFTCILLMILLCSLLILHKVVIISEYLF